MGIIILIAYKLRKSRVSIANSLFGCNYPGSHLGGNWRGAQQTPWIKHRCDRCRANLACFSRVLINMHIINKMIRCTMLLSFSYYNSNRKNAHMSRRGECIRCISAIHPVGICDHPWNKRDTCKNCIRIESGVGLLDENKPTCDWVQCDQCAGWQHGACVNLEQIKTSKQAYICSVCYIQKESTASTESK